MFKCGGASIGVSWAHVLGDAFSAAAFMNLWGLATRTQYPAQPLRKAHSHNNPKTPVKETDPLSVKRVGPLGDHWATSNHSKMETYSFHVSWPEVRRLQSKICGDKNHQQIPPFETICTLLWQSVAKLKQGSQVQVVTICKHDPKNSFQGVITNHTQLIKVVKAESSVQESSLMELGLLLMNQGADERRSIEEAMERNELLPDFLIYGANLTFVDLHDVPFYELNVRGQTPIHVNCGIDNVGDEGVVLLLPAQKHQSGGMMVNITLPQDDLSELRSVLDKEWSLS